LGRASRYLNLVGLVGCHAVAATGSALSMHVPMALSRQSKALFRLGLKTSTSEHGWGAEKAAGIAGNI
jgi:hypothetical protein